MAAGLAMNVTAEGVETVEQMNQLKDLACGFGQGFYFRQAAFKAGRRSNARGRTRGWPYLQARRISACPLRTPVGTTLIWMGFGLCWLGAAAFGLTALMSYDNPPWSGRRGASDLARRTAACLAIRKSRRSSCSRILVAIARTPASANSAELMARTTCAPRAYVVFIKPGGVADEWEKTPLWRAGGTHSRRNRHSR